MKAILTLLLLANATIVAGQDLVVGKGGETMRGRIEVLTDRLVTIRLSGGEGVPGASALRRWPADQVDWIEFGFTPGEEEVFARRSTQTAETLKPWWERDFAHLHRPRSRAPAWGLAYAEALLREENPRSAERAIAVCDLLLQRAWSTEVVRAAKRARLQARLLVGQLDQAVDEARALAKETEDPDLLIEAEYLLALADFSALRELEAEHPRWMEDDEVRPRRLELYHRALDRFFRPHLFHATRGDAAARGLLAVADLYDFGGERDEARARYEDLLRLYGETKWAALAAERLAVLNQNPDKEP